MRGPGRARATPGERGEASSFARVGPGPERQPWHWALLAGLAVLTLYVVTLAPTTAFWDASEYIAVARILGIPHPPGNPLFVLLAGTWSHLLAATGLPVAVRVNLFSATMTAGASVFWFLVVYRILRDFTELRWVRMVGAGAAVALSATAFTVWNQSNVNEKVYTVSLFTIALLTWIGFRWRDHVEGVAGATVATGGSGAAGGAGGPPAPALWRSDRVIVLIVYVLALSVGNHLMGLLVAPALVLLLLLVRPRIFADWRIYGAAAAAGALGLSVQMFLPIRAAQNPIINEGSPTCESLAGAAVSIATFGRAGCPELSSSLRREQYAKPPLSDRQAPFWAQLATYFQYFDWQWSRSLDGQEGYLAAARRPFTLLFLALGIMGAWQHGRRDGRSFAFFVTLFATLSVLLVYYMNFKYGFRQAERLGMTNWEVRERDYFFIASFSVWGLWAGIGLTWVWLRLSHLLQRAPRPRLAASPVLAIALIPLVLNWSYASRAGDWAARDFAYNMLQSVEPYGVLFTSGDNDTFPLWYLQEVEGVRRDVTVIVGSYFNTPWYARQVRDLTRPCPTPDAWAETPTVITCQRPFEPLLAPPIYEAGPAPTGTILPLTDPQIAEITESFYVLPQDMVFEARGMTAVIRAGTYITPADQFMMQVIRSAWGERPIHFSGSGIPEQLGFGAYLARHGISYKLVAPEDTAGLAAMPEDRPGWMGAAYVDIEATDHLLREGFSYRDGRDREVWPDHSTRNIPRFYAFAHAELAAALNAQGEADAAAQNLALAQQWLDLAAR